MNLNEWAIKWGVPFEAVEDLRRLMYSTVDLIDTEKEGESETAVQTRVRLEASIKGCRLWRNNVGAVHTAEGSFIRYGIANDSKKMNESIKSHDLIGIRPIRIKSHHVGRVIGQFLSREIKPENWQYSGSKREMAQLKFLELVLSLGGDAAFANKEGTI